jgi:hypothetical protein
MELHFDVINHSQSPGALDTAPANDRTWQSLFLVPWPYFDMIDSHDIASIT